MGSTVSSLYECKTVFEQKLSDNKRKLKRVLSKSNSMEALDKAEISEIKQEIDKNTIMLSIINRAIEDENALSF
jgi:hypothetical protein